MTAIGSTSTSTGYCSTLTLSPPNGEFISTINFGFDSSYIKYIQATTYAGTTVTGGTS